MVGNSFFINLYLFDQNIANKSIKANAIIIQCILLPISSRQVLFGYNFNAGMHLVQLESVTHSRHPTVHILHYLLSSSKYLPGLH